MQTVHLFVCLSLGLSVSRQHEPFFARSSVNRTVFTTSIDKFSTTSQCHSTKPCGISHVEHTNTDMPAAIICCTLGCFRAEILQLHARTHNKKIWKSK